MRERCRGTLHSQLPLESMYGDWRCRVKGKQAKPGSSWRMAVKMACVMMCVWGKASGCQTMDLVVYVKPFLQSTHKHHYSALFFTQSVTTKIQTFSHRARRNWLKLSVTSPSIKLRRFVPFVWTEQISRFTTLSVLLHFPLTTQMFNTHNFNSSLTSSADMCRVPETLWLD